MAVSSRARPTRPSRSRAMSKRSLCSAGPVSSRISCRARIASISPRSTPRPPETRTFRRPRLATRAELERIHDPAYVDAIAQASADPDLDYSAWGLSAWGDTPPFAGMHDASLLTTGASLVAMEAVIAGKARVAFNGAGGLHHAMRRNASGFCIYNDPAIVCGALADRGMKVAYVDIDAHHGDGVQAAFYDTDQIGR